MSTEPEVIEVESGQPAPEPAKDREPKAPAKAERAHPGPPKSILREYFESAVVTVIMALFGITFVVQAVKVPTGSMQNNIKIGDHLLVNKFVFAPHGSLFNWLPYREISRGDVIVFKYPGDPSINFVKRVIGLPGEKIEIRGTQVYINDKPLPEQYTHAVKRNEKGELQPVPGREPVVPPDSAYQEFYQGQPFRKYMVYYQRTFSSAYDDYRSGLEPESGAVPPCPFNDEALDDNPGARDTGGEKKYGVESPCVIQPGQYFAMGDNRDDSQDGRFWGTVPRENIIGRALVVYWSLDESGLEQPPPSEGEAEGEAEPSSNPVVKLYEGAKYFFTHTRWRDTGRLIR